tara:strand:+ start:1007 stop:1126 length:120 start_codon:yes stop_codon:yes gene_type:complete
MEGHGEDQQFIVQQFNLTDQDGSGEIDFEEFKVRILGAA